MHNCWLKNILQKNRIVNRIVIHYKNIEKHVSLGNDNPDKTFFVVRRNAPNAGLFSFVITNIGWMKYATDRGYIPVVDMQNYYNTYITQNDVEKINSWDYYFKQPCGYNMNDIMHSKNIIISGLGSSENNPNPLDSEGFITWQKYSHKYLMLSDKAETEINKREEEMFHGRRILGVLCRGTDYIATKPKEHPVQPGIMAMLEKACEVMQQQSCEAIYLATEDETIFEKFREKFGERLLTVSNKRYKDTGNHNINEISDSAEEKSTDPRGDKYKKGMDYAVTIGLLSRCQCLVAGQTSGTTGALLLTEGYDYVYLFNLGVYD